MGRPKKRRSGMFDGTEETVFCRNWEYDKSPLKNIKPGECIEVEFCPIIKNKKVKNKNSIKIGDHFYLKGKLFFVSEISENGLTAKIDPVPDSNEKCICGNGKKHKNCCGKKV